MTALLAVLDSAALYLALSPDAAPSALARLCLRGGFQCLTRIARAMDIEVPEEANAADGISLSYEEFLHGVETLRAVDFPIERDPAQAGRTSSAGGSTTSAPPTRWPPRSTPSQPCGRGPRRHSAATLSPVRPPLGRPPA